MASNQERLQQGRKRLEDLKGQINQLKIDRFSSGGVSAVYSKGSKRGGGMTTSLKARRTLRGHFGKVYSSCWSGDSAHLVSASQDGKLIVWNGFNQNKVQSIPLKSSWVIACGYEQLQNRFVACGGLDNICSIFKLGNSKVMRPSQELSGHTGYISSFSFIDEQNVITGSGDGTAILWDIERGKLLMQFQEHVADVMSVAINKQNTNLFVSGSCDTTVKVWDIRTVKSTHTFSGHNADVNAVAFFPDGKAVGSGSDDASLLLFDLRCCVSVGKLCSEKISSGITSLTFSKSGRLLFAGYEDHISRGWDVLDEPESSPTIQLTGHENRVSSINANPAGDALLTGSWDTFLKIWA